MSSPTAAATTLNQQPHAPLIAQSIDTLSAAVVADLTTLFAAIATRLEVDIPLATIQAQTSGTPFNLGAALPANARLLDYEINVVQVIGGGSISACTATVQNTGETAGAIMASTDVHAATGLLSHIGSNPYPSRGAQQLQITLTSTGDTLAHATTGHLKVELFYAVLP